MPSVASESYDALPLDLNAENQIYRTLGCTVEVQHRLGNVVENQNTVT
jgi:hypothetical protein